MSTVYQRFHALPAAVIPAAPDFFDVIVDYDCSPSRTPAMFRCIPVAALNVHVLRTVDGVEFNQTLALTPASGVDNAIILACESLTIRMQSAGVATAAAWQFIDQYEIPDAVRRP